MRSALIPAMALSLGLTVAGDALAQSRPYSPRMYCDELAALVARRGAVVISTSPTTYDRYVRSRAFCQPTEVTEAAWIRSADTRACFVGYTCKEYELED